jgi:hypothetical protein
LENISQLFIEANILLVHIYKRKSTHVRAFGCTNENANVNEIELRTLTAGIDLNLLATDVVYVCITAQETKQHGSGSHSPQVIMQRSTMLAFCSVSNYSKTKEQP